MNPVKASYGGFLPFELNLNNEFFDFDGKQLQRYNSGKTAIVQALRQVNAKKVWMPHYLCPNVCDTVAKNCGSVCYYHIDRELLPQDIEAKQGDCLILVNYFGIMDTKIDKYAEAIGNDITILIDNCHSFFHKPILKENIFNIYSCKKFFGVPDGAYLIGKKLDKSPFGLNYGADKASYLLECLERGTDYCYEKKKEVDTQIGGELTGMSELTRLLMRSIDYTRVKEIRNKNFKAYDRIFGSRNLISCETASYPYVYPLNLQINMKRELIVRKIYVPTLWEHMIHQRYKGKLEYLMADNTIFLPTDQRYENDDILYICGQIESIMD